MNESPKLYCGFYYDDKKRCINFAQDKFKPERCIYLYGDDDELCNWDEVIGINKRRDSEYYRNIIKLFDIIDSIAHLLCDTHWVV
jgi:hypothetical protein